MAYRNFANPELLQQYLNQQFNQPDLSEVIDTNSTEVIDTGMPVFNTFDLTKGGITDIPINIEEDEEEQYPYLGYNNMGYQTPRTIADQNRILGQTFTPPEQNLFRRIISGASDLYGSGRNLIGTGIGSLISLASGIPGIGLLTGLINPNPQSAIDTRRLQQAGYGTQLQDIYGPGGIMQNYNMISAFGRGPLESIINRRNKAKSDLIRSRLDQAITSLGGSTDPSLSAYRASRPASERRSTGPAGGGRDNTGGDRGARGASDSFSNRSGMGRTGY
jgi:hypothetical protein